MYNRQKSSIEKNEQLYAAQYGFREKSSAQNAIAGFQSHAVHNKSR